MNLYPPRGGAQAFLWQKGALISLGDLGSGSSSGLAINARGQVIGLGFTADYQQHGFIWDNGMMRDLSTLGGWRTTPEAINSAGTVVGSSMRTDGATHAFLWRQGMMQDLGVLGCPWLDAWYCSSDAVAVNDAEQIAGTSTVAPSGSSHAFFWQDGVLRDLGTLTQGSYTFARGIGAHGEVFGVGDTQVLRDGRVWYESHAFLWKEGTMLDLGSLGGGFSQPVAMNTKGQLVGFSTMPSNPNSGEGHAFLWDNGVMTDLGTLGGATSAPAAINAQGQVVGYSQTATGTWHAFLWEAGVMTDLGPAGVYSSATAVNDAGKVAGSVSSIPTLWPHPLK